MYVPYMVAITSGTTWGQGSGRREYSVTLASDDGKALVGERWDELPWDKQRRFLETKADILVLEYMLSVEAINKDYFDQRVAEVKERGSS